MPLIRFGGSYPFPTRRGPGTTRDCPGYHAVRLLVTAPDQATSAVFAAPGPLTPVCWGFEAHPVVPGYDRPVLASPGTVARIVDLPKMLRTPEPGKFYNSVDSAEEK
jgi:hypothetical protein